MGTCSRESSAALPWARSCSSRASAVTKPATGGRNPIGDAAAAVPSSASATCSHQGRSSGSANVLTRIVQWGPHILRMRIDALFAHPLEGRRCL